MKNPEDHNTNLEHDAYDDENQLALFELEKPYEYQILDDPEMRYRYVQYTEKLIARTIESDVDSLVFLDKSARPVAWLMRSLWPTLGFKDFDENGEPIKLPMPEMKFANIDREQWASAMGRSEVREGEGITLKGVHPDTIDSLTGLFAKKNMDMDDYVSKDDETLFDDKNVLIIDEVMASGDTLTMAQKLFERAFENAKSIDGAYWMAPEQKMDKRSGGMRNADLPIWYDRNSTAGRGIGGRESNISASSESVRQRRGRLFLSTRYAEMHHGQRIEMIDQKGQKLREDIQMLGREVADGKIPVLMGKMRPGSDEFEDNFMRHVNDLNVEDFIRLRRQAEAEGTSFTDLVNLYKRDRTQDKSSKRSN